MNELDMKKYIEDFIYGTRKNSLSEEIIQLSEEKFKNRYNFNPSELLEAAPNLVDKFNKEYTGQGPEKLFVKHIILCWTMKRSRGSI